MYVNNGAAFRDKLQRGQVCLGTGITFGDPTVSEALCGTLDFVWIDMEHNPLSLAAVSPKLKQQVVTVNGCSKSFSMTGWRIGWAAGPDEIIKAALKFQSHATSDPAAFSHKIAHVQ